MNSWIGLRCKVTDRKLISIGIPVLNEGLNIQALAKRLEPVIEEISRWGFKVEILINDNASTDNSAVLLDDWAKSDSRLTINHFSNTVPFQESILRLLQQSKGDAFVLLQSDLQDPPEVLIQFVTNWINGEKIVAGVITKRSEGFVQRTVRKIFYRSLKSFSDGKIIVGFQDFYLIDRTIVNQLKHLSAEGLFLRGHISTRFGFVQQVPYVRADRERGNSNFNFPAKYSLAMDGLLLFGTRFVRTISTISFSLFCFGVIGAFTVLISYLLGFRPAMHGWASLGMILLTLLALIGMTTGLILEYLIRIYRFQIFSNKSKD
jgi:glycosyltransferase involved in cell wall biosynthesis